MMELNGNEVDPDTSDTTDTNTAPLEILAEFLTLIMEKNYEEAMKHCKIILEYEPQNETVLSFIPLLNEKLKILQEVSGDSTSSGDDNANTDIPGDIDVSSSSDEDAINEGDTSSEISPYSSGSVSILSSDCDGSDSEGAGESDEDCSESIESNAATRSPSLNRSHSSNPDSSRHDVNSNSLDRSNSSKEVQSSDNSSKGVQSLDRSTSNSSKDPQSNSRSSSDVYFSLDSSSSNGCPTSMSRADSLNINRDMDKSTSSSSSTRLGKETINRTLAKTIENIRKKYGIRRTNTTMSSGASGTESGLKNINDLYCAGRN
uniref:Uncharacterized protein n=1 Tax=Cacopsylla melanoneura TaxID=428564 RepID=A0A8D8Q3J6_9HEMI